MKNKKHKKKIKNGPIEKMFIKVLPFSAKTTKTLLVLISIINLTFSAFLFSETVIKLEQTDDLAQVFQLRSGNTVGE